MPQHQLHRQQSSSHRQQKQGSPELAPAEISPSQPSQSPNRPPQQPAQRNGAEGRRISCEDIQLVGELSSASKFQLLCGCLQVQNLIERCLLLYMNQKEVVQFLQTQARVEPNFTSLVWMKLEEQNPEFFKAYYTRLKLKVHISTFNLLLEKQAELMERMGLLPRPAPVPSTAPIGSSSAREGGLQEGLPSAVPSHASDVELAAPPVGELNARAPEPLFSFGMGMNALETNFGHHDPQSMDSLPSDGDAMNARDSLASLSQLPRNFSLSDLTADIGNSRFPRNFSLSDLTADLGPDFGGLANYSSPFVNTDDEAFLRSPERDGFDEEPDWNS